MGKLSKTRVSRTLGTVLVPKRTLRGGRGGYSYNSRVAIRCASVAWVLYNKSAAYSWLDEIKNMIVTELCLLCDNLIEYRADLSSGQELVSCW